MRKINRVALAGVAGTTAAAVGVRLLQLDLLRTIVFGGLGAFMLTTALLYLFGELRFRK